MEIILHTESAINHSTVPQHTLLRNRLYNKWLKVKQKCLRYWSLVWVKLQEVWIHCTL